MLNEWAVGPFLFIGVRKSLKASRLNKLVGPVVTDLGYEFVGLEYHPHSSNGVLRVYIDHPDRGIVVEDCADVSHELSALLEVEDPIPGAYRLEVSSPGLDRPLFNLTQFQQFAGWDAKVTVLPAIDGRKRFMGSIESVDGDEVLLQLETGVVRLPFSRIQKACLVAQV